MELMRRARGIPPDGAPEEDKAMPETERQPRRELVAAAREHLRALQEIINELTQDDGGA